MLHVEHVCLHNGTGGLSDVFSASLSPSLPRQSREKKAARKHAKEESAEEEEEEEEGELLPVKTPWLGKFQRLRHLHYYLWILVHGFGPAPPSSPPSPPSPSSHRATTEPDRGAMMTSLDNTSMDTDALTNEDQGSSESKAPQSPSSSVIPLSVFPWAESVTQLPTATTSSGRGPGWVNFSDLTYHAPLGLWITLISVTQSVPAEYGRYFEEPQQLSKLLHQLPLRVSKLLTKGR